MAVDYLRDSVEGLKAMIHLLGQLVSQSQFEPWSNQIQIEALITTPRRAYTKDTFTETMQR